MGQPSWTLPAGTACPQVLVCVQDVLVREMMSVMLVELGYATTDVDVDSWLAGAVLPTPQSDAMILDVWPLSDAEAVTRARHRIEADATPVILLIDGLHHLSLADRLGITLSLPLVFTMNELAAALQQAMVSSSQPAPLGRDRRAFSHAVLCSLEG